MHRWPGNGVVDHLEGPDRVIATGSTRVLLAGNPNSGKTSLFNRLTGARHKVANYPGVTVEKREGAYVLDGVRYEVLDLPGTYSLTSYSPEERIATEQLKNAEGAVTVVVVESTTMARGLHLLGQVMQIHANPILCLNMWDEFERSGARLDLEKLSELLGVPIVTTVGHVGLGVDRLKQAIARAAQQQAGSSGRLVLGERLERALAAIAELIPPSAGPEQTRPWLAEKLLVGDEKIVGLLARNGEGGQAAVAEAATQRARLESETGMDMALYVTERYHGFIDGLLREVLHRPPRYNARAVSDRIDEIVVHPVLGLPIFLLLMYALFWMAFRLGEIPMNWIDGLFQWLGAAVSSLWPAGSGSALRSLLVDGIIGGVGGVMVFLPNIVFLFLGLAIFEDTGYMARAAFIMDRFLYRFGLHGQSFIPLMTGFGCSIPGIMATRTLRDERDRLTTILVLPLMSCGARLPIWMLLVPAFFAPRHRAPALWSIYVVGVVLALAAAWLLRRTWLRGKTSPFVLELPPYRIPTLRALVLHLADRAWVYIRRAGTLILAVSILLWALASFPKPSSYAVDREIASGRLVVVSAEQTEPAAGPASTPAGPASSPAGPGASAKGAPPAATRVTEEQLAAMRASEDLRSSVAGRLGSFLEPALRPMGLDWQIGVGLIGAFAAKEVFVAQMGVIFSLEGADENSGDLQEVLRSHYTTLAGASLMLFLLIATPCMATVAVTRRETGGWKWAMAQFWGLTLLGYVLAVAVYQIGQAL